MPPLTTPDAFGNPVHQGDIVITIKPDTDFPFSTFISADVIKIRRGEACLLLHDPEYRNPIWVRQDSFIWKCHHMLR